MGISIFETKDQLIKWLLERSIEKYYIQVTTEDSEIILVPRKTSKPIEFGYLKIPDAEKIADELQSQYGIHKVVMHRYSWDIERSPAIKIKLAEE